jgi:rhodanese-related sulfurtransferase
MTTIRHSALSVFLIISVLILPSTSFSTNVQVEKSSNEQVEKNVITLWRAIKNTVPQITVTELKSAMDKGDKFVLLDIRNDADYKAAHLPGALHISRGDLEFDAPSMIPDTDAKIYVYCRTGIRATFGAKSLLDIGYTNVARVSDSFQGWVKAGYPVYNRHGEFILVPNGFEKNE